MKVQKKKWMIAVSLLVAFVLWTAAVCLVDVQPIGPRGTSVGFAALNGFIHRVTGVHMSLYVLTDWLGLVLFGVVFAFALLGLAQWVRRKKLSAVDRSILILGGFYVVVMAAYVFFEFVVINYRPILIEGALEASYPSSTTMLTLCVIPTAVMQLKNRIQNAAVWRCASFAMTVFAAFMVAARLVSGVHWFTDIVGGILLSAGLVMGYKMLSE